MEWITKWKKVCLFYPKQYTRVAKQNDDYYVVMISFRCDKYWEIELWPIGKQSDEDNMYTYPEIDISMYGYELLLEHQHAKCQHIAERMVRNFLKKNPDFVPVSNKDADFEDKLFGEMKDFAEIMMSK